jgi:cytochrome oxidase assembly protein ShyY1
MDPSRRRRIWIVALAAVVAVTCVALGLWQLRRLEDRRARNAAIERGLDADPILLTTAVGRGEPPPPYSAVRASGRFDPAHEVLVYGRALDGEPGHWVVTPLVFDDGSGVLVVRGWVPFRYQSAPVDDAAPPEGEFTIRGFSLPDEGGSGVPDAAGVTGRLGVRAIRSTLPYPVHPSPIQLTAQAVPQPGELPVPIGPPELSEGPHLSYAIQWFSFAAIAIGGAAVLLRRDRRDPRPAP